MNDVMGSFLKPLAALALLAAASTASVPALAQTAAQPQPAPQTIAQPVVQRAFEAVYSVHARGVDAGEFTFRFTQNGASYEASAERRLTGVWRIAGGASQDYSYSTRGTVSADGRLHPTTYRHAGGRRGRVVDVRFTADDILTTANPRMGMGAPPATQAQKRGAIDQISAIAAMIVARGDVCDRTLQVYMDGRSRFDFVMHPDARVTIDGRAYRGQGQRCRVEYRPIAGFSDPQEASTLTFLFAATPSGMFAPIRIEMPTDEGIIVLDARRITLNGQRLRQ